MFDQRETKEDVNDKKLTKILECLATGQKPDSKGEKKTPLDKDQCAYCKEKGHWAKNCPKLKAKLERDAKALISQP